MIELVVTLLVSGLLSHFLFIELPQPPCASSRGSVRAIGVVARGKLPSMGTFPPVSPLRAVSSESVSSAHVSSARVASARVASARGSSAHVSSTRVSSVSTTPGLCPVEASPEAARVQKEFRIFDRTLAALLLLLGAPLFVAVSLLILLAEGRPIFYRGTRLGRNRSRFNIIKFRTLGVGAQTKVGGRLLSAEDQLEIPFGKALRACRLDELPQLFNILTGDMNFWGPLPERPEVYLEQCVQLDGYDRRFRVTPGLIGVSQLFTPHKTPKRLRVRLDNGTVTEPPGTMQQFRLITFTMVCALRTVLASAASWMGEDLIARRILRRERHRRVLKRVAPRGATLSQDFDPSETPRSPTPVQIVDLNENHMRVRCSGALPWPRTCRARLRLQVRRKGRLRQQSARCVVSVKEIRAASTARENESGPHDYVLQYYSEGTYSEYVLHQYFLKNSLATPARFVGKRLR